MVLGRPSLGFRCLAYLGRFSCSSLGCPCWQFILAWRIALGVIKWTGFRVFQYIKNFGKVYCFFLNLYLVIDIPGFYSEFVTFMISLLSVIPYPDAIRNFSYGTIPQVFAWAIHDLGLRDGLLIIAAGATVKITRQLLQMVAK